jgi:uncharacterized protein YeaO (DUF488 family)
MTPNSVINRSSRPLIERHIKSVFSSWVGEWFRDDYDLALSFNDDLWAHAEKQQEDWLVTSPCHILVRHAETSMEKVAKLAMKYDREIDADDHQFWDTLKQKMWRSLLTNIVSSSTQEFTEQEAGLIRPALSVSLSLNSIKLDFLIDKKAFELLNLIKRIPSPETETLTHLSDVIQQQTLRMSASLEPLHATLKDILELKKGDVVKLAHGLQSPIIVDTKDGRVPLGAFLVRQKNTKALLVTGKEN